MSGVIALVVLVAVCVGLYIMIGNNVVSAYNRVENSFSNIDVHLEKRFDEVGQKVDLYLVTLDKETAVYRNVSALRSGISKAQNGSINDKVQADGMVSNFLTMGLRQEGYPEVSAVSVLGPDVFRTISDNEKDLAAARKTYNRNASQFNAKFDQFPSSYFVQQKGYLDKFELFQAAREKREAPRSAVAQEYLQKNFNNNGDF